jgi:acyl-CoA reductase-like NAD-dependent aldehyde dehydrogenase
MLEDHKDEFARTLQLEAGKTNRDAIGELDATIHRLKLTLEEARRIFGPVIPIIRMEDEDEALSFARASNYGLESCVFTKDFYRMWHFAKARECGEVTINDCPQHGVGFFPFGGIKDSGMGREGIGYSIDEMTNLKTIVFNLEAGGLGKKEYEAATCRTRIRSKRYEPADGE